MTAKIKMDPAKLPKPKLEPTHSVRANKPDWISIHCEKQDRTAKGRPLDSMEEQRTISVFYSGVKREEAARLLGISPATYTKRIQRLKKRGAI